MCDRHHLNLCAMNPTYWVEAFGEAKMVMRMCVRAATETIIIATLVALALPFLVVLTLPFVRM
jgi:hypothetical protein